MAVSNEAEKARINRNGRLLCIWCGLPMVLLLYVGVLVAHIMPPQSPSDSAAEVAEHYRANNDSIKVGLALSFPSIILLFPFGAAIAAQIRRIESVPPVYTYFQVAAFASSSLVFIAPWVFWQVAAFRTDRPDTEISLLNDLGWIFFVFAYVAFSAWMFAVGLGILADTASSPAYPRWLGYYSLFVGFAFVPNNLTVFFKDGPLAWDGVFAYWIPFIVYGPWVAMMIVLTVLAVKRESEHDPGPSTEPTDVKTVGLSRRIRWPGGSC